jgi:polyhydroxyalkanoate synthase
MQMQKQPLPPAGTAPSKADPARPEPRAYRIGDPEEFARNVLRAFEEGGKVMAAYIERAPASAASNGGTVELAESTKAVAEMWRHWMADPGKLAEAQGSLFRSYLELWNSSVRRMLGEEVAPVATPAPGDHRFKDPEWSENPYFDYWKQAYLITAAWAERMFEETEGLDERSRHKARFYLGQLTSAMSPANFPLTNPEVMRETFQSNAKNLVSGMTQLLGDMERSGDLLRISQTDVNAFEVGRNLAVTPGKVVYQNDVLQLIQYAPATAEVREVPLLIVPPWINKFYILDLTQPKSFIKYVVDQGFSVFVISWVNPDERLSHKTFEDYMREGILSATDAVKRETGQRQVNVVGYCVGGTLLAATLAYLAARGDDLYRSATFLATQVDFTKAGDLKVFIDDGQLKSLAQRMEAEGYLDGSAMATVFNMLRPRDLIWPYVINNYMLGRKPMPFDLLYWNQDSTRMPAANHNFYLREFYHENKLARALMQLAGTKLDMKKVTLPVYELAAREDHIAPLPSVFLGAKLFGGPVELVVAGSGHIAGVVNPPDPKKVKYQYWTNPAKCETIEDWIAGAKETPGSWWPHWIKWLAKHSGGKVAARKPGAKLGVIEDAPGSYVKVRA